MEEYIESISLNFSHLDSAIDNICPCDQANGETFNGLLLTVNSLKIMLCKKRSGWLDDLVIDFFATILNFSKEYNISSVSNDDLPSLVFADSQDNIKRLNPWFRSNTFTYLNNNLQYQDEDNDDTTKEMVKWYETSTKNHLDRILSVFLQKGLCARI